MDNTGGRIIISFRLVSVPVRANPVIGAKLKGRNPRMMGGEPTMLLCG